MNPLLDLSARPVIGHRGASARAPENTLPAFQLAVEEGAEALELDVHITGDDVPVVIHDATLGRTTDLNGAVAAQPLERVRQADAGARFSPDGGRTFPWRGRGVRVPTLGEVLTAFPDMPLLIEIKTVRAQHPVRRVITEQNAAERCVVAAFEAAALEVFGELPFLRGAAREDIAHLWLPSLVSRPAGPVGYRALCVPERYRGLTVPHRRFVAAARRLGCPVHVWTVNDVRSARRLWRRGVSGIITNFPAEIRMARDSEG